MRDAVFGAKIAVLSRRRILTVLRDDISWIPYPDHWDLPGGETEAGETGRTCALRETWEELGLDLPRGAIRLERRYRDGRGRRVAFFLARWDDLDPSRVVFGDEGQAWALMPLTRWLSRRRVVPQQRAMVRAALRRPASFGGSI